MQIRIDCIGLACHQCVISNAISKMMVGKTIGHIENIFPVCFFICLFKFRVSDFFPKFIFVNCTRLTCLLSFRSSFAPLRPAPWIFTLAVGKMFCPVHPCQGFPDSITWADRWFLLPSDSRKNWGTLLTCVFIETKWPFFFFFWYSSFQ